MLLYIVLVAAAAVVVVVVVVRCCCLWLGVFYLVWLLLFRYWLLFAIACVSFIVLCMCLLR